MIISARILEMDDDGFTVVWEGVGGLQGELTFYVVDDDDFPPVFRCAGEGIDRELMRDIFNRVLDEIEVDDSVTDPERVAN